MTNLENSDDYGSSLNIERARQCLSKQSHGFYGIFLPSMLLFIGYMTVCWFLRGKGEDAGFAALGLSLLMPFVMVAQAAFATLLVPRRCRYRLTVFAIGSVLPLVILIAECTFAEMCLPEKHKIFH